MNNKERFQQIVDKADQITKYSVGERKPVQHKQLIKAIEQLSRAVAMFADLEIYKFEGGKALSHDPLRYIELYLLEAHQQLIDPIENELSPSKKKAP